MQAHVHLGFTSVPWPLSACVLLLLLLLPLLLLLLLLFVGILLLLFGQPRVGQKVIFCYFCLGGAGTIPL